MLKYFQHESPEFKGHEVSSSIEQERELNRMNNLEQRSSDKDTCHNPSDVDDNNRDSYIEHLDNDWDLDSKNSQSADI